MRERRRGLRKIFRPLPKYQDRVRIQRVLNEGACWGTWFRVDVGRDFHFRCRRLPSWKQTLVLAVECFPHIIGRFANTIFLDQFLGQCVCTQLMPELMKRERTMSQTAQISS